MPKYQPDYNFSDFNCATQQQDGYLVMNRKTKIRGRRETDSECENSHPAWANNQYPADSLLKSSKEVKGKVKLQDCLFPFPTKIATTFHNYNFNGSQL